MTESSSNVTVAGPALRAATTILAAASTGAVRVAADAGTLTLTGRTGAHARTGGTGQLPPAYVDVTLLARACSALGGPADVTLSSADGHLHLAGAGAPVRVPLLPTPTADDPSPQLAVHPVTTVTGPELVELASVAPLVAPAHEPVPDALYAVALHATATGVTAAATDRRHLALATVPATGSGRVLLPATVLTAAATALADRAQIQVALAEGSLPGGAVARWSVLDAGDVCLAVREPDGYFPSIGSALGHGSAARVQVELAALRSAVRDAAGEHVWLQVRGDRFTVAALSGPTVNRPVPVAADVSGASAGLAVAASSLLGGLRFLSGALEVQLGPPRMPLLIAAGSRQFVLAAHPL